MADFEVHVDLHGRTRPVGFARSNRARGGETNVFEYDPAWLDDPDRFSLQPALVLTRGAFAPPIGFVSFGAIGDSAPHTWGRRLMQRAERRLAKREGRAVRTLVESDYLLGVTDETRLGALRFRHMNDVVFQAPLHSGVPSMIELARLLQISERILRDAETDEDLQFIFAPGSSLGGARPKASVIDQHGHLSIAKFPKETDEYSAETWEEIALRLAGLAGITTPKHDLIGVAGKKVLLSRRFDRAGTIRTPFLSAMAMLGAKDGERGSYPEIVDALAQHGAQGKADAHALYRRVAFSVLISNVDDHLRNHGFLWLGRAGWSLAPAYDLNPVPTDLKARVLTTNIDLDEGTCSISAGIRGGVLFAEFEAGPRDRERGRGRNHPMACCREDGWSAPRRHRSHGQRIRTRRSRARIDALKQRVQSSQLLLYTAPSTITCGWPSSVSMRTRTP